MKVLFISEIPENIKEYIEENLREVSNIDITYHYKSQKEALNKLVPTADILIGWRPSNHLLKKAKKVKLFINPGAGIHQLIDSFRNLNETQKVLLSNGHGNSYFVAQHAVALLLSLMSKIIPHHEWMCDGRWRTGDEDAVSTPLRFKTIGLYGYGAINQKVHRFLSGFDVKFAVLRRNWNKASQHLPTEIEKFEFDQLHDFLEYVDILIIAVPVTPLTINSISNKELSLLGGEGFLVNVSRGEIVNEDALYKALSTNAIKGAAIDVWYNYTPKPTEDGKKYPYSYPFHELDNIVLSPHRGYSPFEDLLRWDDIIENLKRMAENREDLLNIVDLNEGY